MAYEVAGSQTQNFGTINAGVSTDFTFTLLGAAQYGWVVAGWPNAGLPAGILYVAWVSAADTITIKMTNWTGGNIAVGSLTFMLKVNMEG